MSEAAQPALTVHCSLCGQRAVGHRARLSAVRASGGGVRTETLVLCREHALMVCDLLQRECWKHGYPELAGMFELGQWGAQIDYCDLCHRPFLLSTSGVSRKVGSELVINACELCAVHPFDQLIERAQRAYRAAQKQEVQLERKGLVAFLRDKGKTPWIAT